MSKTIQQDGVTLYYGGKTRPALDYALTPEAKKGWLEWLRDPSHKQTEGYLRSDTGFCCLGGLCEVGIASGLNLQWENKLGGSTGWFIGSECSMLPHTVSSWAGRIGMDPEVYLGIRQGDGTIFWSRECLSSLNDNYKLSFSQIAKFIDEQL